MSNVVIPCVYCGKDSYATNVCMNEPDGYFCPECSYLDKVENKVIIQEQHNTLYELSGKPHWTILHQKVLQYIRSI